MEYSKLKSLIAEYLKSDIPDEDVRCRFLWEIYVLYRVCLEANRQSILDDSSIKKQVDDFLSAFSGESTAPTLMQMLAATKKTVGVKLNASNPAFPVPDFYVSVEPSINTATQGDNILKVDFASIKDGLAAALKKSKSVIYVLVDNIDDFVAREEYKIQKLLLQGLVQTARDYTGYPQIKVKLFLRTELYRKLDFTQLGGVDKIGQRTVELTWTASNIRQFLAERILYNLSRLLEIRAFEFRDNGISVHLDRKSKSKDTWWVLLFEKLNSLLRRSNNHDARSARRVDTMDVVYGSAITTLFPRTVTHFSPQGQEQQLDLFEYLETHFSLSNGETTPRVILLFFDKVISISSA